MPEWAVVASIEEEQVTPNDAEVDRQPIGRLDDPGAKRWGMFGPHGKEIRVAHSPQRAGEHIDGYKEL